MLRPLHVLFLAFLFILGTSPALAQTTIIYFHNDIAGSPIIATDATGITVWKEGYKPYGEKTRNEIASRDGKNKIGYAGSPFDTSTGLSYMGARYYDPQIGRFMGIDPVGFQEDNVHSFNRYAYAICAIASGTT
jgi:RHS repeat-associated protein